MHFCNIAPGSPLQVDSLACARTCRLLMFTQLLHMPPIIVSLLMRCNVPWRSTFSRELAINHTYGNATKKGFTKSVNQVEGSTVYFNVQALSWSIMKKEVAGQRKISNRSKIGYITKNCDDAVKALAGFTLRRVVQILCTKETTLMLASHRIYWSVSNRFLCFHVNGFLLVYLIIRER